MKHTEVKVGQVVILTVPEWADDYGYFGPYRVLVTKITPSYIEGDYRWKSKGQTWSEEVFSSGRFPSPKVEKILKIKTLYMQKRSLEA